MKKNISKALVAFSLIAAVPFVNSCRDALDIVQPGVLTDEVLFTSVGNMQAYLIGSIYGPLEPSYATYLTAVLTDEVKPGKGSGGQEFGLHRFILDSNDEYTSLIWSNNYRVINRVNRLLAGAENIQVEGNDLVRYNNILAQARTIRAFCYLQLLTYFSTDMKNDNALGVLLFEDVPASNSKLPRATNAEVFALIEKDLQFARVALSNTSDRYIVDKRVVNALAARMNLYRGKYSQAKAYAQTVINEAGLSLPTTETAYRNMWTDMAAGEVIFAMNRLPTGNGFSIGTYYNTNASNLNGTPMWFWGRNLYNLMVSNEANGDYRKNVYLDATSSPDPNYLTSTSPRSTDILVVDKYPGKTGSPTRNDVKVFRLSEMYFIIAEAEARANNLQGAAAAVNKIRTARGLANVSVSFTNLQEALRGILAERRVELALEGHRYIDLKRLASEAGVTMDRNQTDDEIPTINLSNDSHMYTLPIPLSETAANANAQQNPGY